MVLLGTEDARFGLSAEDPWMGVSGTKLQKMGLERHFQGLVEVDQMKFENSYNVGEKRSSVSVLICCFPVPWGDSVHAVEAVVLLDVERRA